MPWWTIVYTKNNVYNLLRTCIRSNTITTISIFIMIKTFLVHFTAPNNQSPCVNFVFKSLDRVSNSETIKKLTTFLWVKVALPYLKLLTLNSTTTFALWIKVNFGARLLSDAAGGVMFSSYNRFPYQNSITTRRFYESLKQPKYQIHPH